MYKLGEEDKNTSFGDIELLQNIESLHKNKSVIRINGKIVLQLRNDKLF